MWRIKALVTGLAVLVVASCSTPYQSSGFTGGFDQKELEPGIWRIEFGGNGFTTAETVQTYWLYRVSQLTLEKGYEGFEILSNINLAGGPREANQLAAGAPIFIPIYTGGVSNKPLITADVRMLKRPFEPKAPKVFDAAALKATLEPLVSGTKCDMGNVCAHVHRYLFPNEGAAAPTSSAPTAPPAADAPTGQSPTRPLNFEGAMPLRSVTIAEIRSHPR